MPLKGIIEIALSREQAATAAHWLIEEYKSGKPPPLSRADWGDHQRALAHELSVRLDRATKRKRRSKALDMRIPRNLAQWFSTFYRHDGQWVFGNVYLPGQRAPRPIQQIAGLFLKAVSRRKGRPRMEKLEIADAKDRVVRLKQRSDNARDNPYDSDGRMVRRLTKRERELAWEENETAKAGREPELP